MLKRLLPLFLLLLAGLGHAAPPTFLDACGNSDASGTGIVTATGCDATGANRLVFAVGYGDGSKNNPASVVWGATSANIIAGSDVWDGSWCGVALYEIINPTSTSASVVVTWSGLTQAYVAGIALSGVTSVITPPSTATGSAANPTVAVSGATSGDLIFSSLCTDSDVSATTEAATLVFEAEGVGADTDHNTQRQTTGTTASWTNALSGGGSTSARVGYALIGAGSAPTLSLETPSGTLGTSTTATLGATTDQVSGNFYAVVDTGSNLSGVTATQIKAGQRASGAAAVAACGPSTVSSSTPSCGVTGLTAATAYVYAVVQNNGSGDSNVRSGTFTTAAASGTVINPISGGGGGAAHPVTE